MNRGNHAGVYNRRGGHCMRLDERPDKPIKRCQYNNSDCSAEPGWEQAGADGYDTLPHMFTLHHSVARHPSGQSEWVSSGVVIEPADLTSRWWYRSIIQL